MAFGGFSESKTPAPMSEINVTPMVDVMLVLLVIFIITAPLFTHSIKLDLPSAQSAQTQEKPETISLSIDAAGRIFWDKDQISQTELNTRLAAAARKQPQPELQLRADKSTRYEVIAQVMSAAQTNGMTKMGFVTEPKPAASTTK
ncbi:MAG: biopolymer transporter ExbD [Burkholderiaceae bacterium]|nr:biopolymer transporter ExbD [Burkholderiaceae bacterium]